MIFVCGKLGCGKSTYAKQIAQVKGYKMIEVSDIVKDILKHTERSKLQGHPELDSIIIREILAEGHDTVVSGVRQVSILKAFDLAEQYVWIEVDEEERYRRLVNRLDDKDPVKTKEAFLIAQERDNALGVPEVEAFIKSHPKGKVIHG